METAPSRMFVGMRRNMSLITNHTTELWSTFMPKKKEIEEGVGDELFSIEVYPDGYFDQFDPAAYFEKWAAVEVNDSSLFPSDMEVITIPEGLYVVFNHQGPASMGPQTYAYIFRQWLPASDFELDDRPHLAVMGEKYENDSEDSEEELWIPIKPKE